MTTLSRRGFLRRTAGGLAALALAGRTTLAADAGRRLALNPGGRLERLDAPAFLDDFGGDAQLVKGWSDLLSRYFGENQQQALAAARRAGVPNPVPQFYNPLAEDTGTDAVTAAIRWRAFPNTLVHMLPDVAARRAQADAWRGWQDEYCEWCVERGRDGKVRRVTFTCEGPDYWEYLARKSPDTVVELYRKYVSEKVEKSDLFDNKGNYKFSLARAHGQGADAWNNLQNERGVLGMHLIQPSNTLGAEVNIVAIATLRWLHAKNGRPYTTAQELIEQAKYGDLLRNSDPHIGDLVNQLARLGADVTIANPVALYMDGLNTAGWETPDGSDAHDYWHVVRGTAEHTVRARYEVPEDRKFTVGDIRIAGQPIEYGSQIAEHINMRVTGVACRVGKSEAKPIAVGGNQRGRFVPVFLAGKSRFHVHRQPPPG